MIAFFKNNKFIIIIILSTIVIIGGMFVLNEVVVSIRMHELRVFLREINKETMEMDELGMVTKFKLHRGLYENRIDENELSIEEMNIAYLITASEEPEGFTLSRYREIAGPILYIINFLRMFIQKPPIQYVAGPVENMDLAIAYYYERSKYYRKALEKYDAILARQNIDESELHIVLLHQGYCLSILGEYEEAKEKYLTIIRNFENEAVAITAAMLFRYLEEIMAEVKRVKESDESPLLKSEKLYKLIAFEEAIDILDKVTTEDKTSSEKVEYLKARCYEESGRKEESVKLYQSIIQDNHESETAKLANRRILAVSVSEEESEKLRELSIKNNALIGDDSFGDLLDTAARISEYTENELQEISETQTGTTDLPEATEIVTAVSIQQTPEPDLEKSDVEAEEKSFGQFIEDSIKIIDTEIEKKEEEISKKETEVRTPVPTAGPTPKKPSVTMNPEEEKRPFTRSVRDADGDVVRIEYYNASGTITGIKHKDAEGRTYKVEQYDEKGSLSGYFIYEFDENGNPEKVYAYDSDGNLLSSE
ncbi:MAG: tetratricopeptide repeat protein [Spirochaetales bacterium]|nr:tetratricopeptide repeat protein [Spirochaetales bacterium]